MDANFFVAVDFLRQWLWTSSDTALDYLGHAIPGIGGLDSINTPATIIAHLFFASRLHGTKPRYEDLLIVESISSQKQKWFPHRRTSVAIH